jgi:hypothetical protein
MASAELGGLTKAVNATIATMIAMISEVAVSRGRKANWGR